MRHFILLKNVRRTFICLLPIVLIANTMVSPVKAAKTTTITWQFTAIARSSKIKISTLAVSNSSGKQTYQVTGACSLNAGILKTKFRGFCKVKISVASWRGYAPKTSSRNFQLRDVALEVVNSPTNDTPTYFPPVSTNDPAASAATASNIKFDFTDAVGVALRSSVSSSSVKSQGIGSNLLVVLASGLTRDAEILGTATVKQFLIAPNSRLYVLFDKPAMFDSTSCLLAQVYRTSGLAVCLESKIASIDWNGEQSIQFDRDGNIYYSGRTAQNSRVIRRYANGSPTDYMNQYQNFGAWKVAPNGELLVSGSTTSNGLSWTRVISTSGSISTLSTSAADAFWTFPDGNIYFPDGESCLRRYLVATSMIDQAAWGGWGGRCHPYKYELEHFIGAFWSKFFWIFANGKVLQIPPSGTKMSFLYPSVVVVDKPLTTITFGIPALTSAVIVGVNSSGVNQMVLWDSSTNQTTMLADGRNQIEFYHVRWNAAQNRVYFDGLRFSDNKYVLGYLDLVTRAITTSDMVTKLVDFQTFAS